MIWYSTKEALPPEAGLYLVYCGLNKKILLDYWNVPQDSDPPFVPFFNYYGGNVQAWCKITNIPNYMKQ